MCPPRKQADAVCAMAKATSPIAANVQSFVSRLAGSINRAEFASDEANQTGSASRLMPTAMRPSRAACRMPTKPRRILPVRAMCPLTSKR